MIDKILFIRRDNIGDLVCTTPAIAAARRSLPGAKIGVLVNTYNAEVLANNTDIDEIYVYEKAKHAIEKSRYSVWLSNARLLLRIRKERYDVAVGCGSSSSRLARYTRLTGSEMRIGYVKKQDEGSGLYTTSLVEPDEPLHEVDRTIRLLSPLGIASGMKFLKIVPSTEAVRRADSFAACQGRFTKPRIVMHISSRKPDNRWPVGNFIMLGKMLAKRYRTSIMLLWSPGSENNVYHPGDDEKASEIVSALGKDVLAYSTNHLSDLIAALSIADIVICGDGGAMHIAAGLGKPIVALWGSSSAERWRPYGVRHVLLQGDGSKARNVGVETVTSAVEKLLG